MSEPTDDEVKKYMEQTGMDYYNAREDLRESEYGQEHNKPSHMSWGDYWKSY